MREIHGSGIARTETLPRNIEPCPFCGSTALRVLKNPGMYGRESVRCDNCRTYGPPAKCTDSAIKAWGERK